LGSTRYAVVLGFATIAALAGEKMSSAAVGTALLFQYEFSANAQQLDPAKRDDNRWQQADNPSFLGLTQMRRFLPLRENGMARHALCTSVEPSKSLKGEVADDVSGRACSKPVHGRLSRVVAQNSTLATLGAGGGIQGADLDLLKYQSIYGIRIPYGSERRRLSDG